MTFTPASNSTVMAFLAVVATVYLALVGGMFWSLNKSKGSAAPRIYFSGFKFALLTWYFLVATVGTTVLPSAPPQGLIGFFLVNNLVWVAVGLSPVGKKIATHVPLFALVLFQAFRLPLELVLHAWASEGVIPMTLTWTGQNFDIISGMLTLLMAPLSLKHRWAAWVANTVGFLLLLNVMRVAMMSSPLPFAWPVTPPLQLAFHFPYVLIIPVCVGGALFGHIVLLRRLLNKEPRST